MKVLQQAVRVYFRDLIRQLASRPCIRAPYKFALSCRIVSQLGEFIKFQKEKHDDLHWLYNRTNHLFTLSVIVYLQLNIFDIYDVYNVLL